MVLTELELTDLHLFQTLTQEPQEAEPVELVQVEMLVDLVQRHHQ